MFFFNISINSLLRFINKPYCTHCQRRFLQWFGIKYRHFFYLARLLSLLRECRGCKLKQLWRVGSVWHPFFPNLTFIFSVAGTSPRVVFDKLHDVLFYSSFFILFLRDRMGNICSLFLILFPFHEQLHLFHDKIRLCDFINHEKSIPLYSIIL